MTLTATGTATATGTGTGTGTATTITMTDTTTSSVSTTTLTTMTQTSITWTQTSTTVTTTTTTLGNWLSIGGDIFLFVDDPVEFCTDPSTILASVAVITDVSGMKDVSATCKPDGRRLTVALMAMPGIVTT